MRRILSVLAVATAVLTLAACGGDDDDEATTATTVATTSATGITPPSYTGSIDSEFCKLGRENNTRLQGIVGSLGDENALRQLLKEAAPEVRKAAAIAPPEIKADVTVLADGYESLVATPASEPLDTSVFFDARFQAAATNLNAYAQQVCGITTG